MKPRNRSRTPERRPGDQRRTFTVLARFTAGVIAVSTVAGGARTLSGLHPTSGCPGLEPLELLDERVESTPP
ncbi:hypothetical protein F5972_33805 [Microbispora cellulosiformans]|uniref:Uncharacterized protein n=1 Tax=Microbispora cellulosiformans TaxID=2614688 RepID=A0A5J5JUN8_9ACTN|nr:hypothetical protein [Microbispora cellulosiformans]KAA9373938.1 hypothetical protein F5972_33805 [Microbispora cellulosiformans]